MAKRAAPRRRAPAARDRLLAAVEAFEIRSAREFAFLGEPPVDVSSLQTAWGAAIPAPDALLAYGLQQTLYDRCYAEREASFGETSDAAFVTALRAANTGRERWDAGWIVQQFGQNGQAFVRKGDRERAAMPGAFLFNGPPGMAPQIGSAVTLRAPAESLEAQPGYYYVFGETIDELADQLSLVRVYFHCPASSAAALLGELTVALNRFQVPFQFKTPAAPGLYERTDAAVLYVAQRYFAIIARIFEAVRHRVKLEPSTPLFAKPLWPGVGAAVEPGGGESFGTHRCRLVAEAIVAAWRRGETKGAARLAAIGERFRAEGLDLEKPWLGPFGVDFFEAPRSPRLP